MQLTHSFEASWYSGNMIICHFFWQVEPKIQFPHDNIENEQTQASAGHLQEKLLLFHLKTSKSNQELQQLLQSEVPRQAAKWVMQSKSPRNTQHPAQSLKFCRKLAGSHLGGSKSNCGRVGSAAPQCGSGGQAVLLVPCGSAWHGLAQGLPQSRCRN